MTGEAAEGVQIDVLPVGKPSLKAFDFNLKGRRPADQRAPGLTEIIGPAQIGAVSLDQITIAPAPDAAAVSFREQAATIRNLAPIIVRRSRDRLTFDHRVFTPSTPGEVGSCVSLLLATPGATAKYNLKTLDNQ